MKNLKNRIALILDRYRKIHINDSFQQEQIWAELITLLTQNEKATIGLLDLAVKDDIFLLSSVFEDVAEGLQSLAYINCLERLELKFPDLEMGLMIKTAKEYTYGYK